MCPPEPEVPDGAALYDEAACGLLLTDRRGTILRANRTFCRWIGLDAEALVGHRRFQDLLTMGGRIFYQTHWAPLLLMQGSVAEVKLDLMHPDDRSIPMVMNAVSREHGGEILHELALFVAEDRHAYERELMSARKQAEELLSHQQDRARFAEQMVGIVSHDLRSPLSAITLGAELLARTPLNREQELVLSNLKRSVSRSKRLIDDLLDFTLARMGRGLAIDAKPIDVRSAVANHVSELGLAYPGRSIVHRHAGEGSCRADADRLFQVVSNLVANAMSYGAPDQPVTVSSRIEPGGFRLAVHNRGPMIAADKLPTLFEPMVRGTAVGSGTRSVGLGLYIVAEIARAHGGDVEVSSSAELGTEFTVRFPNGD